MIGVFADILPGGVNWSKSVEKIANELDRQEIGDNSQCEWRSGLPISEHYLEAVYAPVAVKFEVSRGICSRLAHDTADKAGLGLANSQFHSMKPLDSKTGTRDFILSRHT